MCIFCSYHIFIIYACFVRVNKYGVKKMNTFAERIKKERNRKKVYQNDVAKVLGITLRSYQYYEAGERYPDFENLIVLANYLGVSIDYLVGRTENPEVNR